MKYVVISLSWGFILLGCFCAYCNQKHVTFKDLTKPVPSSIILPQYRGVPQYRPPSKAAPLPTPDKSIIS